MAKLTRRAALTALGLAGAASLGGGLLGWKYALRESAGSGTGGGPMTGGAGMMGSVSRADMGIYMDMFNRHHELSRVVQEVPGGVRTTTESNAPDLVAQLQAHVSSMYTHLAQGAEVSCMSQSLPTLFRQAHHYQRHLTFTPNGVIAEETSANPEIAQAIQAHAREVTGFVVEGMPAMMNQMMRGGS
jgi:hypothetical protein